MSQRMSRIKFIDKSGCVAIVLDHGNGNWSNIDFYYQAHKTDHVFTPQMYRALSGLTGNEYEITRQLWDRLLDNNAPAWAELHTILSVLRGADTADTADTVTLEVVADEDGDKWLQKDSEAIHVLTYTEQFTIGQRVVIPHWIYNLVEQVDDTDDWELMVLAYIENHPSSQPPQPQLTQKRMEWTQGRDSLRAEYGDATYIAVLGINNQRDVAAFFAKNQPQPANDAMAFEWLRLVNVEKLHDLYASLVNHALGEHVAVDVTIDSDGDLRCEHMCQVGYIRPYNGGSFTKAMAQAVASRESIIIPSQLFQQIQSGEYGENRSALGTIVHNLVVGYE